MSETKPSYWAVIPADVRYDPELRPNAKLLYGELTALAGPDGYCWASDKYFAELFGLSVKTVNELVQSLKRRGYIRVEMGANSKGTERHIYAGAFLVRPMEGGIPKNRETPGGGYPEKSGDGSPEKSGLHKDNNLNITRNPLPPKGAERKFLPAALLGRVTEYAGRDEELLTALLCFCENRAAIRKPIRTDRALTLLLNKLDRLSGGERELKLALLDRAVECNWLSVFPLREDEDRGGDKFYIPEVNEKW